MTDLQIRSEFYEIAQHIESACRSGNAQSLAELLEDLAEDISRSKASRVELTYMLGVLSACAQCADVIILEDLVACRELLFEHWNGEATVVALPQSSSTDAFRSSVWR
jgi:hypothetical protein